MTRIAAAALLLLAAGCSSDVGDDLPAGPLAPPSGLVGVPSADGTSVTFTWTDNTNRDLRYARRDPGGAWVRHLVDAAGDVGAHAAVAVDPSGTVHIAYRDETAGALKVASGNP